MIADFFTKLLQGNLFKKFRDIVLRYKHISEEDDETDRELNFTQECVRNKGSDLTVIIKGGEINTPLYDGSNKKTKKDCIME